MYTHFLYVFFMIIMPPTVGKDNKRCFCPSVAYIANDSRTQRPSVPKFGRKVPHFRCDSQTSLKVKRSKVRIRGGRGIPCRSNPAVTLLVARCVTCLSFVINTDIS